MSRIAYLGPEGTFTEAALLAMAGAGMVPGGGEARPEPVESTPTALEAVRSGAAEFASEAVAADPGLPAALALQGDALRRSGKAEAARLAYLAALQISPNHPRAAFGLAKLALSGKAKAATNAHAPAISSSAGPKIALAGPIWRG